MLSIESKLESALLTETKKISKSILLLVGLIPCFGFIACGIADYVQFDAEEHLIYFVFEFLMLCFLTFDVINFPSDSVLLSEKYKPSWLTMLSLSTRLSLVLSSSTLRRTDLEGLP